MPSQFELLVQELRTARRRRERIAHGEATMEKALRQLQAGKVTVLDVAALHALRLRLEEDLR